jgi:hypothetical protein
VNIRCTLVGVNHFEVHHVAHNRELIGDTIAERGRERACLVWPPRDEGFPVGYYCGLRDPNGNFVEFSYGQPLGPGAEQFDELE